MDQRVDFFSLPRRQLQTLCKQYKIPANTTNVAMATALDNLLNEKGCEIKVAELLTPRKATESFAVTPGRVTRSQAKKQLEQSAKNTEGVEGRALFAEERSARKPPTRNLAHKEDKGHSEVSDGELSSLTSASFRVRKPKTPRPLDYDLEADVHGDSDVVSKISSCSSGLSSDDKVVEESVREVAIGDNKMRRARVVAGAEAVFELEGLKDQTSVTIQVAEVVEEGGIDAVKSMGDGPKTGVEVVLEAEESKSECSITVSETEEKEDSEFGKERSAVCAEVFPEPECNKDEGTAIFTEAGVLQENERTSDGTETTAGVFPKSEDINSLSSASVNDDAEAAGDRVETDAVVPEPVKVQSSSVTEATRLGEVGSLEAAGSKEAAELGLDDHISTEGAGGAGETDILASAAAPGQADSEFLVNSEEDEITVKDNVDSTAIATEVVSVQADDLGAAMRVDESEKVEEPLGKDAKQVCIDTALAIEVEQLSQALSEVSLSDGLACLTSTADTDTIRDPGCEDAEEVDDITSEDVSDREEDDEDDSRSSEDDYDATDEESDSARDVVNTRFVEYNNNGFATDEELLESYSEGSEVDEDSSDSSARQEVSVPGDLNFTEGSALERGLTSVGDRSAECFEVFKENGATTDETLRESNSEDSEVDEEFSDDSVWPEATAPGDDVEAGAPGSGSTLVSGMVGRSAELLEVSNDDVAAAEKLQESDGQDSGADEESGDKNLLSNDVPEVMDDPSAELKKPAEVKTLTVDDNIEAPKVFSGDDKCEEVPNLTDSTEPEKEAEAGDFVQLADEEADGVSESGKDSESSEASTEAENGTAKPKRRNNTKRSAGKENVPVVWEKLSLRQLKKIHKEKLDSQRQKEAQVATEPMQKKSSAQEEVLKKKQQGGSASLRKPSPLSPNSGKNNRAC